MSFAHFFKFTLFLFFTIYCNFAVHALDDDIFEELVHLGLSDEAIQYLRDSVENGEFLPLGPETLGQAPGAFEGWFEEWQFWTLNRQFLLDIKWIFQFCTKFELTLVHLMTRYKRRHVSGRGWAKGCAISAQRYSPFTQAYPREESQGGFGWKEWEGF